MKIFVGKIVITSSCVYAFLVIILAGESYFSGIPLLSIQLIKLFVMALCIGTLRAVKKAINYKQWMMKLPFALKRVILAPLY
ncbi:MAG: hypothetical protein WCQ54_11530, partial [Clostridiaceae bacterium]